LKADFKQTDVGPIPIDWDAKPVSALAAVKTGPFGTLLKADEYDGDNGVPLVSVGEIGAGRFRITERTPLVPDAVVARLPQYVLRAGDIVFGRKGAVDRSVLVTVEEDGWFLGSDGMCIRPTSGDFSPYLAFQFQTHQAREWLLQNAVGTTMASLNQEVLRRVTIPIAPLPEQCAIAAVLNDVDALLGALDRLIAKKRDLKQAAMQQLLTGRTRLPGFAGNWVPAALGRVGAWFSGGTPSKSVESFWAGDIPWVSPKDMKCRRLRDAIDHVSEEAIGRGTRLVPAQTILLVVRGMILSHSAPVARVERSVAFNQDIKALVVAEGTDSNFLLWWLVSNEALLLSKTNESTHGTKRLPTEELFKLEVSLPPPTEQTAIAAVLTDMDAELAALEARRDKTRLLKQGMMQELLSGRTRLL